MLIGQLLRGLFRGKAAVLPLMFLGTAVQAATCYGRVEGASANIYCSGEGGEDESCSFLWALNDTDGSDRPWRGEFTVTYSEMNALKMSSGPIASTAGSLNIRCSTILQTIGAGHVGDVAQDQADHNVVHFQQYEQGSNLQVAKAMKARTRQTCKPRSSEPMSALAANRVQGYDEDKWTDCRSR